MTGGTQHSVCRDEFASRRSGTRFGSHWSGHFLNAAKGVENQFHAARYAQFVENAYQIIPNCVFRQAKPKCDFLVSHALSNQAHHISFACCQPPMTTSAATPSSSLRSIIF